ncbi:probable G-protein coupled receptor Mth-like 10 isoform X3 [Sitophilus oryzae]|uniref:Probable G-protein coupled receptor Mth-like 10 isoform X3 n=1 Tax=Sitophilus oryzae TaxID=7048 RepID=A0A6J2XZX6_SITOR|nr:probable G-protein coupled receptor Mth-like 10 isoform X3 [Sitophilus oryzae]
MTSLVKFSCVVFLLGVLSKSVELNNNSSLNSCDNKVCIRKCCKEFEAITLYDTGKSTCQPFNQTHPYLNYENVHPVYQQRCGKDEYSIYINHTDTGFLSENGSILVPSLGLGDLVVPADKYCFDHFDGAAGVFLCFSSETVENEQNHVTFGMIISMPFLLMTFLVYLVLPEKNVHQVALMFYVLHLLLAYVCLVTINLSPHLDFCHAAAYMTLFFFVVSFFWMNVICFDIWYTFSGGRGYGSKKSSEKRKLILYTLYAEGLPLLHLLVVYLMDRYMDTDSIHKPNIGVTKCFLADGFPNLWYFYGEASISVIANIVFFIFTALKIRQVKKETSMLKQNESKRHTFEKEQQRPLVSIFYRFNLYLKLLLAMGVNWSMEIISWLVNWLTNEQYSYIWYITDFVNAAYGVIIFFIFVFKKKMWKLLQKRYYNLMGKPHLARAVTSTTDTRTSHYSSTNYSSADTHLTDRTTINDRTSAINRNNRNEEIPLHRS